MKTFWLKMAWVICAIFLGVMSVYSGYYVNPELGVTYGICLMLLSFPVGLALAAIVPAIALMVGIDKFNIVGDVLLNLLIIIIGYCQWFIIVPLIKNKMRHG